MSSELKQEINRHGAKFLSPLEEVYSRHIIGKGELKVKLGQFNPLVKWHSKVVCISEFSNTEMGFGVVTNTAYDIPEDMDEFVAAMFDLSLTHNIMNVVPDKGKIYVAPSKNGKTNITKEAMDFILRSLENAKRDAELEQICTRD